MNVVCPKCGAAYERTAVERPTDRAVCDACGETFMFEGADEVPAPRPTGLNWTESTQPDGTWSAVETLRAPMTVALSVGLIAMVVYQALKLHRDVMFNVVVTLVLAATFYPAFAVTLNVRKVAFGGGAFRFRASPLPWMRTVTLPVDEISDFVVVESSPSSAPRAGTVFVRVRSGRQHRLWFMGLVNIRYEVAAFVVDRLNDELARAREQGRGLDYRATARVIEAKPASEAIPIDPGSVGRDRSEQR